MNSVDDSWKKMKRLVNGKLLRIGFIVYRCSLLLETIGFRYVLCVPCVDSCRSFSICCCQICRVPVKDEAAREKVAYGFRSVKKQQANMQNSNAVRDADMVDSRTGKRIRLIG